MLPADFVQTINGIAEKEAYLCYEVHTEVNAAHGESHFADTYKVDIKGKTQYGRKELNLFVKINRRSEDTTVLKMDEVYQTELYVYKELSDIFAEMQEQAKVPLHERYTFVKCYDGSNTDAIILENIAKRGYDNYHRMDIIPLHVAELLIKELAKLHALSFALEMRQPEYFNRKLKGLQYPFTFGADWYKLVKSMMNAAIKNVDKNVLSRVQNAYYSLSDKYEQYFRDETTKRCLCHGDYKAGNVMMKMNNGQRPSVIPVDYQFLHYGCPALDFIYLIFMSTDKKFREAHLSHLKDLYHESLTTFLVYFNMDVDLVYPRKTFEQDYKKNLDYGLLFGYVLMPLLLIPEDYVPDLTGQLADFKLVLSEEFKSRQREMIEEFIEWGYIV